jgi:isoquinoline 1-oxidoreductase subunit beta
MSALGKTDGKTVSRRDFLSVSLTVTGGMLLGFPLKGAFADTPPAKYVLRPEAFIRIDPDSRVTLIIPQEEMGQGVYTSLSQLLADELDVAFDQVTPEPAPPSDAIYGQPAGGGQGTGGSTSIRAFYTALRQVGASARAMLVQAAAQQWQVDAATLRTENGQVIDDAHNRKLDYGALAPAAAKLPAPQNPKLKADKDLKLIGKPLKRLDTPDKVNGNAQYGIDVRMPGLKIATLMAAPAVGGKLAGVDQDAAMKVPGVRQVVVLDDLVAVVGDHFWAARQGLAALKPSWHDGANATRSSDQIMAELQAIAAKKGAVAKHEGDPDKGLARDTRVDATYQVAFLAHAPMEPMNFTVHVMPGACEMWGGSQVQATAQATAAKTLGIPQDKVTFHNYMLGGGFGRRLDTDMVEKSVRIAQKVDGPVKVIWTREEDMRQDMYRPAYRNVMSAAVNSEGKITAWTHRVAGGSVVVRMFGPLKNGVDEDALDGAMDTPYDIADRRIEYVEAEPRALKVGWWRGVAPNNTIFAGESLMDELAQKAGQDPIAFRLAHLNKSPRLRHALEQAAQLSSWGTRLPARQGRGVCAQFAFGTFIATVAEVAVDDDGQVHLKRMTSVVDAGRVVNPDTLVAQVQGGLIFGCTAALYGNITVKNGRIEQANFNDYRMMRINEAPMIDVHIIKSSEAPGGIGEPGCTAGPPSLINAIAAATGVRLRTLPVDRALLAAGRTA